MTTISSILDGTPRAFRSRLLRSVLGGGLVAVSAATAEVRPSEDGVRRGVTLERTAFVMGTSLRLAIEADNRGRALAATESVLAAFARADSRLSTWRDDSALATLNRAPGGGAIVRASLAADLRAALRCAEATDGAFDPTLGALVEAWGLRTGGAHPSAGTLAEARRATGYVRVRIDEVASRVERPDGIRFEEGGFGKGAALRDALHALEAMPGVTAAALDIGGQVAFHDIDGSSWTLEIADPRDRHRPVIRIDVPGGSVATTGNSERGFVVDGRPMSHVLDPRTGTPAADVGSVSVWTADPFRADCLSTALFVMGADAALAWATDHAGVEALILEPTDSGLLARATDGLRHRIHALAADVTTADVTAAEGTVTAHETRPVPTE